VASVVYAYQTLSMGFDGSMRTDRALSGRVAARRLCGLYRAAGERAEETRGLEV